MVFELRGKVKNVEIESEMQDSYLNYAMSVIIGRALPDVRDGLKPVHRRILHAMNDMGMTHTSPYKKSARIVGEVLGKYHPHGDTAVYDSMVRMAQVFSYRYPLVDGHGNFGSVDGDSAAAMRYTEARLSRIAEEMLADIDKDTVNFIDNFDNSLKEPEVLPSKFPNLLVNGSSGIAVGMATNIPPHNLGEVVDAIVYYIDHPKASVKDLMKKIKGPDFPTGGIIMGVDGIVKAYENGRGRVVMRGRVKAGALKKRKPQIIISELPYQVNKAKLIEKIAYLVRSKKIEGITDLRDESDKSGMRVVIEVRKTVEPKVIINHLYKNTQLEETFGVILIALVNGVPRTLNLISLIDEFKKHRYEVVVRRTKYELKKAEDRAHILEGLIIALDNLDEVIKTIRSSKDVPTAKKRLVKNFDLTPIQAQAILDMKLQRLTGLEMDKIKKEHKQLLKQIKELKELLGSEKLIYEVLKDELLDIKKKYNDVRRTDITSKTSDIEIEDLIPEEENVISVTHSGYIKRVPVTTYRKQRRGGRGVSGMNLKQDDFVEHLFISSTHHYIMFFSSFGKVYRLKVHELPTGSRTSKGKAMVNILPFSSGEKVRAIIAVKEYKEDQYLIIATRKGLVKKTKITAYDSSRKDGIIAISIKKGDELIKVEKSNGNNEIVMVSRKGKAIRFSEKDCRPMGRTATGVKGMDLAKGDEVLTMMVIKEVDSDLFVLTENGFGKRTALSHYKQQNRGGLGMLTIKMNEKKGKLAGAGIVKEGQDLMVISTNGILIRMRVKSISKMGRSTQGVKIMNLDKDNKIASFGIVAPEN